MKTYKKGENPKFDPKEIPELLEKAKAGDIEARNELLFRFQRLISGLINVLITGRPNLRSSFQVTFLKLFGGKSTPLTTIAMMLKKELSVFDKDELFSTGQLAVMQAIEKCETNLASAIVFCFKDLIHRMIKDGQNVHAELSDVSLEAPRTEDNVSLEIFITEELNDEEREIVFSILADEPVELIPENLKSKFNLYLG